MNLKTFLYLLFLTSMSTMFSQKNFDKLWQNVEDFERVNKPKSALQEVMKIENLAHQELNVGQEIKALLYRSKYTAVIEEESLLITEQNFKDKISSSTFPQKNILQSMLATMYGQYLNGNLWQIRNRTELGSEIKSEDFRTWSSEKFNQKISALYLASLENRPRLQKEKIGSYDVLLNLHDNSKNYRPYLYDLLAHEALRFFKNDAVYNAVMVQGIQKEDTHLLSAYPIFLNRQLETNLQQSGQLNSLAIYQQLTSLHLKNKELDALVQIDLERLSYVRDLNIVTNSTGSFITGLKESSSLDKKSIAYREYDYQLAYSLKNDHPKQAVQIGETILKNHPETNLSLKTKNLVNEIKFPSLQIEQEAYVMENKVSKFKVKHKNTDHLNATTHKVSRAVLEEFQQLRGEEKEIFVKKMTNPVSAFSITTKNEKDYLTHSSEFGLPKHQHGLYFLIVQNDDQSLFSYQSFTVSNLVLNQVVNGNQYQIIDRNNGKPVSKVAVELRYRDRFRQVEWATKAYETDQNGFFFPTHIKGRMETEFHLTHHGNTTVFKDNYVDFEEPVIRKHTQNIVTILTDRSIYRPGQTVYFKLIALHQERNKSQIIPNLEGTITLKDPNWKDKAKINIKTSEYGSASGSFVLPSSGLNGRFLLNFLSENHGISGNQNIQVEEYKRPKFQVDFEKSVGTYAINDTVQLVGNANSYAGSKITNAQVSFRVTRTPKYPRWCHWYQPIKEVEIAQGVTLTNHQGEFTIPFKALPDLSIDPNNQPTFIYQITADVTDLNGETRSNSTTVRVGYHTLNAQLYVDSQIEKNTSSSITISTTNLNHHTLPTTGTITMSKLSAPDAVLSGRLWSAPDYHTWTKAEHRKLFPTLPYGDEDQIKNWTKGKQYLTETLNTKNKTKIQLDKIKDWPSGYYVVESEFNDPVGGTVKDQIYVLVFSQKDKQLPDHKLFEIKSEKNQYQIGEKASIRILSAAKNLYVTVHVEKNAKIISSKIYQLNGNGKKLEVPVKIEDVGGFSINYSFSYGNKFYAGSQQIYVPYPKPQLQIETRTFRNKLDPNQEEKWEFKISGPNGEKVAAELLANMYDMSLDQYAHHRWSFHPMHQPHYWSQFSIRPIHSYGTQNSQTFHSSWKRFKHFTPYFDRLNWFGFYFNERNNIRHRMMSKSTMSKPFSAESPSEMVFEDESSDEQDVNQTSSETSLENQPELVETEEREEELAPAIRKNLKETAFFYPTLKTDSEGVVSFTFTTPEALTTWKVMLLAYTQDLNYGSATLTAITQKELMVLPNVPRFVREGDTLRFESKITNMTSTALKGTASLQILDALTEQPVEIIHTEQSVNFEVNAEANTTASWTLIVPEGLQAVKYRIIAKSGNFSDGEESIIPVVTNRMLVTESMGLWVKSGETKTMTLDKLKNTKSQTLTHHQVTLEMTSNPAWYAIKALPYLMEYPHQCAEQTFSRYYANALAQHIVTSNPVIQRVFEQWKSNDALVSNLEKNPELKSILIAETPWLRDAETETEQMKRIALLFDINQMSNELGTALEKLKNLQQPTGAWSWFEGGHPNRHITQHITEGFGHLKQLGLKPSDSVAELTERSLGYLDQEFKSEYEKMKKWRTINLKDNHLTSSQLHFLYTLSFFEKKSKHTQIENYYLDQIQKYWTSQSLYNQGLCALIMKRSGQNKIAQLILESLSERSITSEELGMYWKPNTNNYSWYQSDIETQALLIEVFSELSDDTESVDQLKIWLLKNKQTNQWKSTKATTEAVYALLLQGTAWLQVDQNVTTTVGGNQVSPTQVEAGSGYFKTSWNKSDIKPEMATVTVTKSGDGIAWGALYWQYFEDLDQITPAKTPLSLDKKLFLKKNTSSGPQLIEIKTGDTLEVGDLITARIVLQSDRDMEFVHMKDMRASGLEPTDVISGYRWQDGLGYYQSTKDASTNFFFDSVRKGIYVFEYDLRASNKGIFSNGITSIESMYAPEFRSHSEGIRIKVE